MFHLLPSKASQNASIYTIIYSPGFHQDLPGFTRIHPWRYRHGWLLAGEKVNTYKYPLPFLKWWSSLILKTFTVPAETIPSTNLFHSSQTLLANLNFPTSKRSLFLNSLKLCPLLAPSPNTWKKSIRVQILKTPQNLEDLDQVSPQESCLKSSEPQDPQPE